MYIQVICDNCKRSVSFKYSILDGEMDLRCPLCNAAICRNDASHLYALAEKYENVKTKLRDLTIVGLFDGKGSRIIDNDIDALEMMYHTSDAELKKQIEGIVDQLYLTLDGAIRMGNRTEIAQIAEKVQSIFNWQTEQKNVEFERFVFGNGSPSTE